jgi:hypothetical protein
MAAQGFFNGCQDNASNNTVYTNDTLKIFSSATPAELNKYSTIVGTSVTIATPNVANVPRSNVSNNAANGELASCIIVNGDGGSANTNINNGPAYYVNGGNLGSNICYNMGVVNFEQWASNVGNSFANWNAEVGPCDDATGTSQTYPGNVDPDNEFYNVLMPTGLKQGQSAATKTGTRAVYRIAVGNLGATLAKIQSLENKGRPSNGFGYVESTANDETAAAAWLAHGYGILLGNQPAFWSAG